MARPTKNTQPPPRKRTGWAIAALIAVLVVGASAYLLRSGGAADESGKGSDVVDGSVASRKIYSETADPKADIAAALKKAAAEHKRVIVALGADWCIDCKVLDIYMHQPPNAQILAQNFVLVHVWIGNLDQHLDIPAQYGMPLDKVPELAVLAPNGDVVYAQRSGEFSQMRQMNVASVTDFLNTWKS